MNFNNVLMFNFACKNMFRLSLIGLLFLTVLASLGCVSSSVSESSDSLSASIKSSSKSFTSSSGESKEAYLRDIKQYTVVYTRSNPDMNGFMKGLTIISERYGVMNWESYPDTFFGIGAGFAKANIPESQMHELIYVITKGDPVKVAAIHNGFSQSN
ncbi:MAG: putative lipoprotein [Geobacteraceae bacterium]|nr:putative lipoprotein [Geobacteraceae bacterium]